MKISFLYLATLCFCYFGTAGMLYGQSIQYAPGSANNFLCTVPPPSTNVPTGDSPYRLFLIEYGDGNYATIPSSSHNIKTTSRTNAFSYSYPYYDIIEKATNISKAFIPSGKNSPESFTQKELPRLKNIQLYSLINAIRPLEKTHIVCTYRNINCVVAFFYNKDSASFFKKIKNSAETFADDSGQAVKAIRCYNGQSAYTETTLVLLKQSLGPLSPAAISLQLAWEAAYNNGRGFRNALFILNKASDNNAASKNNIFLTLLPQSPRDSSQPLSGYDFNPDSITLVRAQIIAMDGKVLPVDKEHANTSDYIFKFTSGPREAHNFQVYRDCRLTTSERYTYALHFTNDGPATAKNVTASMRIPATANINLLKSSTIKCTFGGTRVNLYHHEPDAMQANQKKAQKKTAYFGISRAAKYPAMHTIYFYFPGLQLPGTKEAGSLDNRRSAHIIFTLPNKTKTGGAKMGGSYVVKPGAFPLAGQASVRNTCLGAIHLPDTFTTW